MIAKPITFRPLLAMASVALLAGCASTPPAAETPTRTTVHSTAPLLPSALFPGSAEQFQAWHCQPAHQDLVTALNGDELRLWSLHGAWRLPQAVVASGARYQDGEISFWNRGEQAQVETPRGQLQCQQGWHALRPPVRHIRASCSWREATSPAGVSSWPMTHRS